MIEKDHQILLARNAANTNGIYSLIAGFIEPGETAEQADHREVYEEVGLKVKQVTYIDSQSWIYPDSLMLAFTTQYESGDIECRDGETAQANWFTYDNLPPYPEKSQSIAKRLIDHFITTHSST